MNPEGRRQPTTTESLDTEIYMVTGNRCGWKCDDHHAETFPGCQRAPGHAGAQVLVDVHVARGADKQLVTAAECCPAA